MSAVLDVLHGHDVVPLGAASLAYADEGTVSPIAAAGSRRERRAAREPLSTPGWFRSGAAVSATTHRRGRQSASGSSSWAPSWP